MNKTNPLTHLKLLFEGDELCSCPSLQYFNNKKQGWSRFPAPLFLKTSRKAAPGGKFSCSAYATSDILKTLLQRQRNHLSPDACCSAQLR